MEDHIFKFALLESRPPRTVRRVHIRRLYDILQLSVQRGDFVRARRAWSILIRCKEIDWKPMWTMAVHLLSDSGNEFASNNAGNSELLRAIMLQHPEERENVFRELVLRLILSGRLREALEELELYLPSFPYQDNPVLHAYAGLTAFYLAWRSPEATADASHRSFDSGYLRQACTYFERAKALDEKNTYAVAYLNKITDLREDAQYSNHDSEEDEDLSKNGFNQHTKRTKI